VVAIAVAGIALALFRHGSSGGRGAGHSVPHQISPQPQPIRVSALNAAQRSVLAHDHACTPRAHERTTFIHGSPGGRLLSILGVLRRPATPADRLTPTLLRSRLNTGASVYIDYIRRASSASGKSFYLIPEAGIAPLGPIPPRCYREMTTALERALHGVPAAERTATLHFQAEQLALQRQQSLPVICFAAVSVRDTGRGSAGFDMDCGSALPSLDNLTIDWLHEHHPHGGVLIAGPVPDGVSSVTLRYSAVRGDPARTITSRAVNNAVVFEVPPHTAHQDTPTELVVRDRDGRVIRRAGTGFP
jgi:hypothetical protein